MNALHQTWERLVKEEVGRQTAGRKEDPYRPKLHIAPPTGWLNDPNGLCQYRGLYHAFYQFAPFDPKGGLKFWGHCTSRDLLHWEYQGAPLMPDEPYDCHGVYSGSALVEEDRMYLYYTGNVKHSGEHDHVLTGRESNTVVAVSADGLSFGEKELLMTCRDYPGDLTLHVRDPKVWKQDGVYYMVQGARTKEDRGVALLFSSKDRRQWSCIRRFEAEGAYGYMWECPDLYELDGRTVLCISPQGMEAEGLNYVNWYQSGTFFLDGSIRDLQTAEPDGVFRELDGGFDFYAPQSFEAEDGRRIQIAWMGMPDVEEEYQNRTVEDGWQHVMTIPRQLSVRDGILCQDPVKELEDWWNREAAFEGGMEGGLPACCEWDLSTDSGDVEITLAEGLELVWKAAEGIFWMRFTDASLGCGRTVRGRRIRTLRRLRILVDVSCVEVFINDGSDVFSTRFYPGADQYRIRILGSRVRGTCRWHAEE